MAGPTAADEPACEMMDTEVSRPKRVRESSFTQQLGEATMVPVIFHSDEPKRQSPPPISQDELIFQQVQAALQRARGGTLPRNNVSFNALPSSNEVVPRSSLTSRLMIKKRSLSPSLPSTMVRFYPESAPPSPKESSPLRPFKKRCCGIPKSRSEPSLVALAAANPIVTIQGPASATTLTTTTDSSSSSPFENTNPEHFLKALVEKKTGKPFTTFSSLSLENFFVTTTPQHIAAYDTRVLAAVRQENLEELRLLMQEGRTLQCCNKFGESIIHMACRRGSTKLLQFLLDEANVNIKVRDDYGRTPLHDACWTQEPEFDLVKILMDHCPDLLYVSDKRGHMPLSYARRDHWGKWCQFLQEHCDIIMPKELGQQDQ